MRQFVEVAVDFGWRCAHDQVTDRRPGESDVLVGAHQVDLRVGQHDPGLRHVLDGVLRFAVLAGDSTDRSGQMCTFQRFNVVDLERLQEQLVQPKQCERIVDGEAEHERLHEVGRLLNRVERGGLLAFLDLDRSGLRVEADLQFEVFDDRREQLHPVRPQRRQSMERHEHLANVVGFAFLWWRVIVVS